MIKIGVAVAPGKVGLEAPVPTAIGRYDSKSGRGSVPAASIANVVLPIAHGHGVVRRGGGIIPVHVGTCSIPGRAEIKSPVTCRPAESEGITADQPPSIQSGVGPIPRLIC